LVANLSLLSEIYAVLDFDKMIAIRERFQQLFPAHFERYLNSLDSLSFEMFWPGCLECKHFSGKCEMDVVPSGVWAKNSRFNKYCELKEGRLHAA
jgi:hypothetical protein